MIDDKSLTQELLVTLGRIDGQNNLILYRLDRQVEWQDEITKEVSETKERVTKVERRLNWYPAYAAGAAATVGAAVYALKGWIAGFLPNG
ncbi:hypothetical protein ABGN05_21055 [Aquibium sp. LZ166]|uniref:Uncharacterized protein n=1 Tax=Aquibium pacificus TaxID=3153579 RepID=A0ABV3SN00_9HYPH